MDESSLNMASNSSVAMSESNMSNTFIQAVNGCYTDGSVNTDGTLTKEQADLAMFLLYEVFMPIICVVGITGNLLCVIVLYHAPDKSAFLTFLKALTISDIFILLGGVLRFICTLVRNNTKKSATLVNSYCKLIVGFGLGNFVGNISSSLVVIMSVERFVAVACPLYVKSFVLERHPRRVIAVLLVVQIILRAPTVIWTGVSSRIDCATNSTIYYLEYREWSRDIVFRRVLFYCLVVIDRLVPVLIVLCMNAGILISLKRRPKLSVSHMRKDSSGSMEKNKITVTLLVLSTFYLCTSIPNMAMYILVTLAPEFTLMSKEYYLYSVVINTQILIVVLNAANDFVIYILSSNRFRALFKEKFCVGCKELIWDMVCPTERRTQETR